MTSRRTEACQYGSRAELAIIVARQFAPIEMSSPADVVSPLWQAMQLSETSNGVLEIAVVDVGIAARSATGRCGAAAANAIVSSQPHEATPIIIVCVLAFIYQPSKKPPSNQSHSR